MEYEVEGSRPRGRPKRTRREVMEKDCQARQLNKDDAMDQLTTTAIIHDFYSTLNVKCSHRIQRRWKIQVDGG